MADLKLPFFILNLKVKTETVLQCVWNVFLIDVIPHYLPLCDPPPMPAMNHVSFAVILTCYNFFLFLPFNLDFLFYSSSQSWKEKTTFQTCISVFLTYFSISLPLFPLSLLLLFFLRVLPVSMCDLLGHLWTMTLPYTQISFSVCVFTVCVCFFFLVTLYCCDYHSKYSVVDIYLLLVYNFSYPRLPMCDVQSGSSSSVRADCALAPINWLHSRRKRIVWAVQIFGSRPLLSMPFDPCAATHKKKKVEESRHWFHDVITGCSVLASISVFWFLDSVNIFFVCFHCNVILCTNRFRRREIFRVLSMLQVGRRVLFQDTM